MPPPSFIRRRLLRLLAAAGLLGPAGISGLVRNALANGNKPIANGMHKITGDVRVNGQTAREGMLLSAGDTIQTGPGAQAIYVLGKDAFLQRDNSAVQFGAASSAHLMRVITGKILSVFDKGQKTILVSTATIGIRGTGCYIEDEPAKVGAGETATASARTYFCLCYGSVDLTPKVTPQETESYSTQHHDHPLYIHDDAKMPKSMVPAPIINHTDLELTMLESLVGRQPPFQNYSRRSY